MEKTSQEEVDMRLLKLADAEKDRLFGQWACFFVLRKWNRLAHGGCLKLKQFKDSNQRNQKVKTKMDQKAKKLEADLNLRQNKEASVIIANCSTNC